MSETRKLGVSIVANWAALLSGFLVTYFLSPFVVNHLGAAGYGTWVILGSLTSYMALMDLGMRGAVTRFVAKHQAAGDHDAASQAVSAALWFRQCIAVVLIIATPIITYFLDDIVTLPPDLLMQARVAFVINATTVVVVLVGGVFGGVLAALNHYTTISVGAVMQTIIRATATVILLRAGYSLIALALIELSTALLVETTMMVQSFRLYPQLRVRFGIPEKTVRNELTTYSGSMMLVQIIARAAQYSQTLIIGWFFSVGAVAFFAIGQALIESVRQVLLTIGPVLMPFASRLEATGRNDSLRTLLATGTRLTLVLTLPILVTLFIRGETFIGLWMGPDYAPRAGEVVRILAIGTFFIGGTNAAHNILFGMGALRPAMVCNGLETAATVVLSFILIPYFGIAGCAWAATAPVVVVRTTLWPRYVCRLIDVSIGEYVWEGWGRPLLAAVPFAVVSVLAERYWPVTSILLFFAQVSAAMLVYVVACLVALWPDVRTAWTMARPAASHAVPASVSV